MEIEEKRKIESDEIDLIALFQTLWAGRKTILKFFLIFGIIGLFIAIFSPKEYTATTVMVPASSEKGKVGGNLGGLAAIAGINLSGNSSEVIPPALYPKVVKSLPFKKELAATELTISGEEIPVSFSQYYADIYNPGLLSWIKKYTIGLPSLVVGVLRGGQTVNYSKSEAQDLLFVTRQEKAVYGILDANIQLEVKEKEGYVELSASMPEAVAAAQLAEKAQRFLQERIIEFKSKKAKEQLQFIEERLAEKEKEFRKAEFALASFQDKNKNVVLAQAATKGNRLEAEYNLAYSVYSELAKKLEAQKIQVKEDTPVFTILEPVSVPVEKSKPRRAMILVIWLFLGVVVGIGVVFGREWVKKLKEEKKI